MKKIVFIFSFALFAFAESYFSLHQSPDPQYHKIGFKNQIMNPDIYENPILEKNYLAIEKRFSLSPNQELHLANNDKNASFLRKDWCGDKWQKVRVYLPSGLKNFTFGLYVIPNTTIVGVLTFIPDGDPHPSLDMTKVKYIEEFNYDKDAFYRYFLEGNHPIYWPIGNVGNFLDFDYLKDKSILSKKSGWIYLDFMQASEVEYSWGGHRSHPKVTLSAQYYLKDDRTDLQEWFKKTKFDQFGDPVEDFSQITQTVKSCNQYDRHVTIFGNGEGTYLTLDQESVSSSAIESNTKENEMSQEDAMLSSSSSKASSSKSSAISNANDQSSLQTQPHTRKCNSGELLIDGQCIPQSQSSSSKSASSHMETNQPAGIFPGGEQGMDVVSSSSSSSSAPTRKCNDGEMLIDGQCIPQGKSSSSKSTSSYTEQPTGIFPGGEQGMDVVSSSSSSSSAPTRKCNDGEMLIDGQCIPQSSSSKSASSQAQDTASSSSESFHPQTLAGKEYKINGFFIRYGDGAYDYIYITSDGKMLAKLEGIDKNGNFKYKKMTPEQAGLKIYIDRANNVVKIVKMDQ